MRKKLLKVISIFLIVALMLSILCINAGAYNLFSGSLLGGISGRNYYVGCSNSNYVNSCNGSISDWDYTATDFSFTRTYTTFAAIRFWGEYHPEMEWDGLTVWYNSSNVYVDPTLGGSWDYCNIILNTYYCNSYTYSKLKTLCAHEVGHCLGLDHTSDPGTLMYPYPGRIATVPTADEVNGVNAKY